MDLQKFMEDIKTVVQDGEQLLKASATEIKGKAIAGAKSTDRLVRTHPYQTVGIMLGLGLIVGLLASRACGSGSDEGEE
ncbi:MAG: hypothetical protein H7Y43_11860 [Akkermansiaceae bacterium]|nr:hypothetical protein [Verrucomicrobiales bacterium]